MAPILNQPFIQIALPIMFTMLLAGWLNNRGVDRGFAGIHKRLDDLTVRVTAIEARLVQIESRLGAVEVKAWR